MFHLEIAGLSILFTGDYSREHDRHLIPATFPPTIKVDVLITESTYGVATHVPRLEREAALMKAVTSVLDRGGRALLPVFALGRAQELLLIFDEYWARHPEYQKIPIYYASNLARKCMVVYQTYIGAMNENIKRLFRERMAEAEASGTLSAGGTGAGPWDFRFIRSLKSLDRFDDVGGCVMLASPGMMQSGVSRELLERWAPDQRNGVIITGYSVEGTMAKTIMNEPEEIPAVMNRGARGGGKGGMFSKSAEDEKTMIPRRCTIQEFSFAAHVDGKENQEFINEVNPSVIVSSPASHFYVSETFLGPVQNMVVTNECFILNIDTRPRRETQHDAPALQARLHKHHPPHQRTDQSPLARKLPGVAYPHTDRKARPRRR